MTEAASPAAAASPGGNWLVDPGHPLLAGPAGNRLDDATHPDRLAWNTFRSLAYWNTDVWVPSLLEGALGPDNPLSGLEWANAAVEVWGGRRAPVDAADVLITGRDALVLVETTFRSALDVDHLAAGVEHAIGLAMRQGRQGGYVLILPEVGDGDAARVGDTLEADLLGLGPGEAHGLRPEAVTRVTGWWTWGEVGRLLLDLAEEADPMRAELAHGAVTELQASFPGIAL